MAGPITKRNLPRGMHLGLLHVPAALWLLVLTSRIYKSVAQESSGGFSAVSDWEALPSDQPGNGSLIYWNKKERNRYHWWTACEAKPHREPPSAGPYISGYCPKAVGDCLLGRHRSHQGSEKVAEPAAAPAPALALAAAPAAIASLASTSSTPPAAEPPLKSSDCIGALCCVMYPYNQRCQPTLPLSATDSGGTNATAGGRRRRQRGRRRLDPESSGTILVQFEGRLGNNLIQLAAGYRLANALGSYKVEVSQPSKVNGWLNKKVPGRSNGCRQFDVKISDKDSRSKNTVSHQFSHVLKLRPKCIELDGYFQDYGLFRGHREELRSLLAPSPAACNKALANPPKDDELVFHIRDASLKSLIASNKSAMFLKPPHHSGYIGPPSEYYHRVIKGAFAAGAKSLTVVVDPTMNTVTSVVNQLLVKEYGAKLPKGHSVTEDLCYVTKAKRLAINGGTFGWIGAFLGSAQEVHYPLSGLLDHERSLNYPGGYWAGPRKPGGDRGLHCDELFPGVTGGGTPASRGKSMVVDDPGWWFHDIGGNINRGPWRWFGKYSNALNRFKWFCGGVDPPPEYECNVDLEAASKVGVAGARAARRRLGALLPS